MLREQWGLSEPFYDDDEVVGEHPYVSAFHPLNDNYTYDSATEVNESSVRKAAIAAHNAIVSRHHYMSKANKKSNMPTGPFVIKGCIDDERMIPEPRGQAATDEDATDEEESEHAQAADGRVVEEEEEEESTDEEEPTDDQRKEKLQPLPSPEDSYEEDDDTNAGNGEEDHDERGQDVVRSSAIIQNNADNNSEVDNNEVDDEGV